MDKRGKLIVIDGSDGSGKATQTKLLVERLGREGVVVHSLDFPRYKANLVGALIGEAIAGDHGDFVHLDPYITAVIFSADRFESSAQIKQWLEHGDIVVLDRFVSANQIHQGGKIADSRKRTKFLTWLDKLEYGVFGLPKPDLTIYLHMPLQYSLILLKEKSAQNRKSYVKKGKVDTFENDTNFLKNALKSAEFLMKHSKNWHKIKCADKNGILSREVIHEKVYDCCADLL